jgi:hypothetical protein
MYAKDVLAARKVLNSSLAGHSVAAAETVPGIPPYNMVQDHE